MATIPNPFKFNFFIEDRMPPIEDSMFRNSEVTTRQPDLHTPTVEDVHREFFTACDTILQEVEAIGVESTIDKAVRLEALGFHNSKDVIQSRDLIRKKEIAEVVRKYAVSHPNNKVISGEAVEMVNAKYNLYNRHVSEFIGFVPKKNMQEIESFKFPDAWSVSYQTHYGRVPYSDFSTKEEAEREVKRLNEAPIQGGEQGYVGSRYTITPPQSKLSICAPAKDIQLRSYERLEGNKIVHVPDPIVLFPVENHCYLIVTAWGDEASDPEVVNEKMN